MQTKILTAVFLFAAFGATQDVDLNDFPRACQQACQDIANLSNDCDNQNNDDDAAERDCVCNANNAQQQANSCAACVKANIGDNNDDDDDDLEDLFRACGWNFADVSSTSSLGTASSTQSSNGTTSGVSSTTSSLVTTTETIPATTSTGTESGTPTTETIPATTVTSTRPASATETEDPDNAGASLSANAGFIIAGLMAALPAIL
ncbi:hypothetical protein F4802DRAFT_439466 [Xylaria palmicola]|nr:hypothetical protein F4802DRAFT_439466 [Xylaria palmicola]